MQNLIGPELAMICTNKDDSMRVHDATGITCISADVPTDLRPAQRLAWKRQFMDDITPGSDWWCCVNDNIERVQCVPYPMFAENRLQLEENLPAYWRSLFNTNVDSHWKFPVADDTAKIAPPVVGTPNSFKHIMAQVALECEKQGTTFGGIGGVDNYFFRMRKWNYMTFIRGDCFVSKRDGGSWFPSRHLHTWDDWHRTLDVLKRHGKVACLRYAIVRKVENEAGGLGPEADRAPSKIYTAQWLMQRYPGLVGLYKGRPDTLQLVPRSRKQLEAWRLTQS